MKNKNLKNNVIDFPNNIYFIQENPNLKYFYEIFCKEKQIKRTS